MRTLLVIVALACACKKEKPAPPPLQGPSPPTSTVELDALWALAPAGAIGGIVVSPRGLARLEAGLGDVLKFLDAAPELAFAKRKLESAIQDGLGTPKPSLAAVGMTASKGFAFFAASGRGEVMVLPLADRDKFLVAVEGTKGAKDGDPDTFEGTTCKTVRGVYACGRPAELLDELGGGKLTDHLRLAGTRGDIEITGTLEGQTITFAAVAQLERGTVVVRGAVNGLPAEVRTKLVNAKPRIDARMSGFAIANIPPLLQTMLAEPDTFELAPGVSFHDLARTVTGPLTMTVSTSASPIFDTRIPLSDEAPAKKLLDQCDSLPALQALGAKLDKGVCRIPAPQLGTEFDAWVEAKQLRFGTKGAQPTGPATAPTAIAKELADGEWIAAAWGRGSMYGAGPAGVTGALPDEALAMIRGIALLNEAGFGARLDGDTLRFLGVVRTAWSNPDEVVAKLLAIPAKDMTDNKGAAAAKAIADGAPGSPFAADFAAGWGGLMVQTAVVGMLAAVAIPAYMDYMKKSKTSEARLQLARLEKTLKTLHATDGAFPKAKVPLTPGTSCCEYAPLHKCIDEVAWGVPAWKKLDFALDEPHLYRYSYESDGKTFTVEAVGDLDCDTTEVTWTLQGSADAKGEVTTSITPPPPNSD